MKKHSGSDCGGTAELIVRISECLLLQPGDTVSFSAKNGRKYRLTARGTENGPSDLYGPDGKPSEWEEGALTFGGLRKSLAADVLFGVFSDLKVTRPNPGEPERNC